MGPYVGVACLLQDAGVIGLGTARTAWIVEIEVRVIESLRTGPPALPRRYLLQRPRRVWTSGDDNLTIAGVKKSGPIYLHCQRSLSLMQ